MLQPLETRESGPSIRQLVAFEAVAKAGSISLASQLLRLSQPAVTHSLNQLEEVLGLRLLDRHPDGTFPNDAGSLFLRRTNRFFSQVAVAVQKALGAAGEDDRRVRAIAARVGRGHMRNLIAIWKTGGFRAAAELLGLSDPGLQRPARELERVLGVTLYRRSSSGLSVNETGAEFARRLVLALDEIDSGAHEIGAVAMARASIRVGVLPLSPRAILAKAAATVLDRHAGQKIEVFEGSYELLAKDIHNGALDVIFGALRGPALFADLLEEELFEDPYRIVCRRNHPLTQIAKPCEADLAGYEWVFPTQGMPRRGVLNHIVSEWKLSGEMRIETSSLNTIIALLTMSNRLSLLSHWHIALDQHSDLAGIDKIKIPHARRCVGLTTREGWLATPFQNAFLESMRLAIEPLKNRSR